LDLTEHLAGPLCSMILGDMGASVIKIERREVGDNVRGWGPFSNDVGLPFTMVNRNKRSLTLDLKHPEAAEVVTRLVRNADVFVENYRPGVMDRLGLGYASLRQVNEGLVYCSISGFGQTGPYRERGGNDGIAQAMTGLMSVTGDPDGAPAKAGYPVTDLGTALNATIGILVALLARSRSGRGQHVDCSLFDTGVSWSIWQAAQFFGTGEIPRRHGSGHTLSAPYQAFATRDGHLMVGASSQTLFLRLASVMGMPELVEDVRFGTQIDRSQNRSALIAILSEHFPTRSTMEWFSLLDGAGIPCAPINTLDRVMNEPQTLARQLVQEVDHPVAGRLKTIGSPIKLSETPATLRSPAPSLGEHTDEVLRMAGYTPLELAAFREKGVV
jgi:crotonobetainyl-CoA:carnitine CoA-transferase CaiB-like acyl-CoA transferase